ncbi:putative aminoglycoside phosphotransferase [Mycolicibacterium phlei]|jgi:aminoglycoside phosphotransferase (APT) family kinase protein|uniref:Aminoglycoside phosphotransferase n=1 Tax=Mycolicibacterium phlei DSM 43239 = CCUG 21000 TaxID=1226750 RepID=A0A5N5UPU0_MYCPH|nr:phosphotransferase family protein [Mycolicibacterium phlei]VEG08877.1 putative aminoglycoside phosphotransferase [Mycobacteroides chelonae]AMO60759.1 Putative aminoglycoside phosphotransferase [Mycolicibacterium phlei]EID15276.1 putative aminoglycoside phosphotransferase [Mycolicibacterium phlei RIVM601174]KAB7751368.1 aminoglycoside phosphotransferase [Mycolicibacterium phlei DSM 43239 = CCUG 21000]KXW68009.1 aminoglycoside phosphotransferase [Mycolicibacterium phlei DSM 43239 = CCUG 21000
MPDDVQQLPTLSDEDQAALTRWVRREGLGETVSDVEPLTGGTQNIVVRLRVDDRAMVLRRPPLHPRPTSDKTMLREIAALRTLAGTPVPHPEFIAGCDDLDVLGVVFYLMEEVDGFNPGDDMSEAYERDPAMRHQVGLSYAASLAELSRVPWEGKPLAELKRPGSFLQRQVPQFLKLLESYRHDRYDPATLEVAELAEWLTANLPPDGPPGILHGDPHLSNVMLRRDRPELAAFVDWEMCTIGDPLLDLGWILICWPLEADTIGAGARLAALGGLASRRELLDAYLAAGGRETDHLDWYIAMACFKLGIVIEGTWSRFLVGQASREAGERLHTSAQNLIDVGTRVAKGDNPFAI